MIDIALDLISFSKLQDSKNALVLKIKAITAPFSSPDFCCIQYTNSTVYQDVKKHPVFVMFVIDRTARKIKILEGKGVSFDGNGPENMFTEGYGEQFCGKGIETAERNCCLEKPYQGNDSLILFFFQVPRNMNENVVKHVKWRNCLTQKMDNFFSYFSFG